MSARRIVPVVIFTGLFVLSFLALSPVPDARGAVSNAPSATTVNIGAYIVNIGDLNIGQGTFTADFYLWFSWHGNWSAPSEDGSLDNTPLPAGFELMNGEVSKSTLVESDQNISGSGQNYLIYRIQADMSDPVNLKDYPFDSHMLTIEVEDEDHNISSLVYVPDAGSAIDPLVGLQGWTIRSSDVSSVVIDHFYNTTFGYPGQRSGETYSRFIVSVPIERPVLSSVVQAFIPILLILMVAYVAFFIKITEFGTRLSLNVLTLLTAAAFQITLTSGIPQFGFLTLADRLIICVYGLLVYGLIVTVALSIFTDEKRKGSVKRLNEVSRLFFPVAAAVLIIVQLLF